jgi:hypothetical protein
MLWAESPPVQIARTVGSGKSECLPPRRSAQGAAHRRRNGPLRLVLSNVWAYPTTKDLFGRYEPMSNVSQQRAENPTTSRSKVVASWSEKSRFLRLSLADLLRFIRRKRLWPEVEGDLSSWIFWMHGFREERCGSGPLEPRYDQAAAADAGTFLAQLLGPGMDAQKIEISRAQSQRITDEKVSKMIEAQRSGNQDGFQSVFSEAASALMDAWKIPPSFSQCFGLTFEQAIKLGRATRATLVCVALHNEYPLVLIARASKGDRRAVLDLVRVDSLFMHDPCCFDTIKRGRTSG